VRSDFELPSKLKKLRDDPLRRVLAVFFCTQISTAFLSADDSVAAWVHIGKELSD
jgi:hypothetical protein